MEPTLVAGQGLIGLRSARASVGQIRCVEHPGRPGFWLVKRVGEIDGSSMRVLSDNPDVPAVDSRQFGAVPIEGSYRVVVRIPLRWM